MPVVVAKQIVFIIVEYRSNRIHFIPTPIVWLFVMNTVYSFVARIIVEIIKTYFLTAVDGKRYFIDREGKGSFS